MLCQRRCVHEPFQIFGHTWWLLTPISRANSKGEGGGEGKEVGINYRRQDLCISN